MDAILQRDSLLGDRLQIHGKRLALFLAIVAHRGVLRLILLIVVHCVGKEAL